MSVPHPKLLVDLTSKLRAVDEALGLELGVSSQAGGGRFVLRGVQLGRIDEAEMWTVMVDDDGFSRMLIVRLPHACTKGVEIVALSLAAQIAKERCQKRALGAKMS